MSGVRKNAGFSLLEVLVAVAIIGLCFSVLSSAMSGSMRGLERVEGSEHRVELARLKLAELDLLKRIRTGDTASGQFDDGTRWRLDSFPFVAPIEIGPRPNGGSVIRIDLTLEWAGRNGTQKKVIPTYRYILPSAEPIPSLEEQLHEIQ